MEGNLATSSVHNVQIQLILQNRLKEVQALYNPHGNKLLGFYQAEGD